MKGTKDIDEVFNKSAFDLWGEYIQKLNKPYEYLSEEGKKYVDEAKRIFGDEVKIVITPIIGKNHEQI